MASYPTQLRCGDFDLWKPNPTFEVAEKLYSLVNKNRQFFRPWLGWVDFVKSPEDEWAVVQSLAQNDACKYLIRSSADIIGMVGVVRDDKINQTMEIGYWLDRDATGMGIMTRAVKQVQDLCFGLGKANRVEIRCAVGNMPSRAIPKRLDYEQEALLRQAEVLRPGVVHDILLYSKLKSDWAKWKQK